MKRKITVFFAIISIFASLMILGSAETEYTISYNYGIASVLRENITNGNPNFYISGSEIVLKNPECPGFVFDGWYYENDRDEKIEKIPSDSVGDIHLYAKWYEQRYSVNYVINFPSDSVAVENPNATSRLTSEAVYLLSPVFSSDAYYFGGWYTDAQFTEKIDMIEEYLCGDICLYAKWENAVYSIRYNLGDVTASTYPVYNDNPTMYEYGTSPEISAPKTDDSAFKFAGWFTDESFTRPFTSISDTTTGDLILYAKWDRAVYDINYILTDGTSDTGNISNPNPQNRYAAQEVVLSEPVSDNKSIRFDGWFTSPDFSENTRIGVILASVREPVTLYAKWTEAVYKINYDYPGMNLLMRPMDNKNPTEYRFGDKFELLPVEADGFIFNGWCTDSDMKNKIDALSSDMYGDITLYADFTEKTYAVNYILDCGDVPATRVYNQNASIRLTSESITLKNAKLLGVVDHEFAGWFTDEARTQRIREIRAFTTENITLYAKWVKIVEYVPVWGDATLSNKLTAADARLILRYSAKLEPDFTEMQLKVSDLNNDSKVNSADARLALRLSAHLVDEQTLIDTYLLPTIQFYDGEIVFVPNDNSPQ